MAEPKFHNVMAPAQSLGTPEAGAVEFVITPHARPGFKHGHGSTSAGSGDRFDDAHVNSGALTHSAVVIDVSKSGRLSEAELNRLRSGAPRSDEEDESKGSAGSPSPGKPSRTAGPGLARLRHAVTTAVAMPSGDVVEELRHGLGNAVEACRTAADLSAMWAAVYDDMSRHQDTLTNLERSEILQLLSSTHKNLLDTKPRLWSIAADAEFEQLTGVLQKRRKKAGANLALSLPGSSSHFNEEAAVAPDPRSPNLPRTPIKPTATGFRTRQEAFGALAMFSRGASFERGAEVRMDLEDEISLAERFGVARGRYREAHTARRDGMWQEVSRPTQAAQVRLHKHMGREYYEAGAWFVPVLLLGLVTGGFCTAFAITVLAAAEEALPAWAPASVGLAVTGSLIVAVFSLTRVAMLLSGCRREPAVGTYTMLAVGRLGLAVLLAVLGGASLPARAHSDQGRVQELQIALAAAFFTLAVDAARRGRIVRVLANPHSKVMEECLLFAKALANRPARITQPLVMCIERRVEQGQSGEVYGADTLIPVVAQVANLSDDHRRMAGALHWVDHGHTGLMGIADMLRATLLKNTSLLQLVHCMLKGAKFGGPMHDSDCADLVFRQKAAARWLASRRTLALVACAVSFISLFLATQADIVAGFVTGGLSAAVYLCSMWQQIVELLVIKDVAIQRHAALQPQWTLLMTLPPLILSVWGLMALSVYYLPASPYHVYFYDPAMGAPAAPPAGFNEVAAQGTAEPIVGWGTSSQHLCAYLMFLIAACGAAWLQWVPARLLGRKEMPGGRNYVSLDPSHVPFPSIGSALTALGSDTAAKILVRAGYLGALGTLAGCVFAVLRFVESEGSRVGLVACITAICVAVVVVVAAGKAVYLECKRMSRHVVTVTNSP